MSTNRESINTESTNTATTDGPDQQLDADPADQPVTEVRDEDLTPYRRLSEHDREGDERILYDPRADDPDLRDAGDGLEEPDDPDFLTTDELGPGVDDEDGWEPPDSEVVLEQGQTLDERLAAEVPEPDPRLAGGSDGDRDLLES